MIRAAYGYDELRRDGLAGITVAAISLPQAMAYALIAGVDPRYGLYSAIVVTAIASVFGSSSHLINGPTNAISLVVFSALAFFDPEARPEATEAMFLLGIMAGSLQILIAVFRLGDLTRYISESVVLGFMAGAGLLVALGQVGNVVGMPDRGGGHKLVIHRLYLTLTAGGPVNVRSLAVASGTVVLVVLLRKVVRKHRLPQLDMFVALVVAATAASALGWSVPTPGHEARVSVVGSVPSGLPWPHIPEIKFGWVREMSGSALAIALLGLLEAMAIAKSIAYHSGQTIDFNRQCLAEGLANLGGGFFQSLPGSGSLTRSAINYQAGAATRASGIFASLAVAFVVVVAAPLARYVPKAALAGLLLVTAARLIDWKRLGYALRASRYDAGLVLVTALAALLVSIEFSILIGVGLSILLFLPRASRLRTTELWLGADRVIRRRLPSDPPCRAVLIYDVEGELFFGAAPELDGFFEEVAAAATTSGARVVVLRLRRTRNPDLVCMEKLEHFLRQMDRDQVLVLLSGVRDDIARAMQNLRFDRWLPAERVFASDPLRPGSSTIEAVRFAYGHVTPAAVRACPHCYGLTAPADGLRSDLYYVV
jgi:SulP family sulfate permease